MKTTPNIINWLSNKAGALSPTDSSGYSYAMFASNWKDIRGLHTQLQGLSAKETGKYFKGKHGGNAPDATYKFLASDGVLHRIELFATGRISYTKSVDLDA